MGRAIVARAANKRSLPVTRGGAACAMGLDRVPVRLLDISAKGPRPRAGGQSTRRNRAMGRAGLREALAALSAEDRKLAGFAAGLIDGADQPQMATATSVGC